MQTIGFVGKIYNMKSTGKGDKLRLNFRLAVRKKYVSEDDKKDGKVNVFVPLVAFGKTAELIEQYFEDGSAIGVSNCEYTTFEFEGDDGETVYGHNFKVGNIEFLPSGGDDAGGGSKKSSGSKKRRRDDDDDEEEEERPRRKKPARNSSSGSSKPAKKRPVYDDEDDEDEDDLPF